jgi:hypothetical protein
VTSASDEGMISARTWTAEELDRIGQAEELRLAPRRPDGTLHSFTVMWVVCANGDLYVRSAGGPKRPWFRHARTTGNGRIRAGGVEVNVHFAEATPEAQPAIDAAYHEKYDRYGANIVGHVTGPDAYPVTVRLVPAKEK